MPDLNNPILRSPNQVIKISGFAQKSENITETSVRFVWLCLAFVLISG